jgi:acetyl esterase/lipase
MPTPKLVCPKVCSFLALVIASTIVFLPGAAFSLEHSFESSVEHQVILLWPQGAPGSEGKTSEEAVRVTPEGDNVVSSVHRPSITAYLPAKDRATGAAVLVVPGGGYAELWMDHEGYRIAQWLSDQGVAGFVLKYRLPKEKGSTYTIEGHALPDIQRALRLVRNRAAEWGIDPQRIGVMGFSAGGHLSALASTRFDSGKSDAGDPIDRETSRPAFQALIYPGVPQDLKVSKDTPPAFLLCGGDDRSDIAEGLPELYLTLRRAGVSAELHVFAGVGHGFGLRESNQGPVAAWLDLFYRWLGAQNFLGK